MTVRILTLSAVLIACSAGTALADTVVLNFEGIASPSNPSVPIGNYYNGGGGAANNFGITFSSNALAVCLNTTSQTCSNGSRGGQGDPTSQGGGLFFLSGAQTYLDDAAGFKTGFSLFYTAINNPGSLSVYSGLDGTGTLLGTLALPTTASDCPSTYSAGFCPFEATGLNFSGTAESISFAGVENQIAFDDVTFGSSTPGMPTTGVTPEPSSIALLATGLVGAVGTLRKRRA